MKFFPENYRIGNRTYRNLVLGCIVFVQLLMIGLIRFWPVSENVQTINSFEVSDQELIFLEEITITRQASAPPPPQKPTFPPPVPTDEIIEEEIEIETEVDLTELQLEETAQGTSTDGQNRIVGNPQRPPSVVRIVEASGGEMIPNEYKGNLEIIVNFLVDSDGEVEEANIMEIRLYNSDGSYEQLDSIEQELINAILNAAMQWRFRPAIDEGVTVKAFTRQRFNY